MGKYLKFFSLFIVFLFISCGGPPEGLKEINLLDIIYNKLNELNTIRNNRLAQKKFFENLNDNFNFFFVFKRDSNIVINGKEAIPDENTILYSLSNNKFKTVKSVYMTYEDKKLVISLDNKTWYSTESDAKKNIVGIKNNYTFEPVFENDNKIIINYSMAFSIGEQPKIVQVDQNKKIITLKKDLMFSNKDKKKINIDLKEIILFVPKDTILFGSLNIEGNLIASNTLNGIISIFSLKDIYVYINKNKFALSFDRSNWDVSIFSFDVTPSINVTAIKDNEVFFDIYASAVYDKDKKSMSIVQLLLRLM